MNSFDSYTFCDVGKNSFFLLPILFEILFVIEFIFHSILTYFSEDGTSQQFSYSYLYLMENKKRIMNT